MSLYIGIDNGVSGTLAALAGDGTLVSFIPTPTTFGQDYTKTKKNISRINTDSLWDWLCQSVKGQTCPIKALLERPMVNPMRFQATASALRALEATLITLEALGLAYQFLDSKEWQKAMLPAGIKGDELKKASEDIGVRLFPQVAEVIKKHGDADGLLIAEYARRRLL